MTISKKEADRSVTGETTVGPPVLAEVVNLPSSKSKAASVVLVLGTTLGQLSTVAGAAILTQLPTMGKDLDIPEARLQWPVTAYSITGGIGGAAIIPSAVRAALIDSIGIIAQEFPPGKARSIAFATFSCGAPVGGSIGMLVGGAVTELSSIRWRAMFFILCGMAALSAISVFLVVPKDVRDENRDKRVDWVGAGLVTASLVLLLFALAQGEVAPSGWKTAYIVALLVVSIVGLSGFIAWEHYLEAKTTFPPLMKLSLWKRARGKFAAMQAIGFFQWMAFMSWGYWVTLYYQNYLGLSPVATMLRFIPLFLSGATCNLVVAMVVGRIDGSILLGIGCTATGVACLLFANIVPHATFWAFGFPSATLVVFGADFVFATGSIFVAKVALPEEQSLAGGVFNTLMQVGGAIGLAISGVVADRVTQKEARKLGVDFDPASSDSLKPPLEATLKGYRAAQWLAFAFCMLALTLVVSVLRGIGKVGRSSNEEAGEIELRKLPDVEADSTKTVPAISSSAAEKQETS
ncbi:hypothetical protein FRC00_006067 [Tulasnella sp. 408]|nr:hypothetical protein FRC00_006067 [Tulasnella sp. 408]